MLEGDVKLRAIDAAKYFMDKKLDTPRNTFSGNMKLQKLLYFAQLVSLAKFDEPLFRDKIYAFKKGMVIDDVRKKYKNDYQTIINCELPKLSSKELETLKITVEIYGKYNAQQLSEITHDQLSWKEKYRQGTCENGYHKKSLSVVDVQMLEKNEVPDVKDLIRSNEASNSNKEILDGILEFNGSKFHFDKKNIDEDTIKSFVNKYDFPADDYVAYIENQEVLVY